MPKCPRCDSPHPHLHPAMQFEGEVQPCPDEYHGTVTASNTAKVVAEWREWCAAHPRRIDGSGGADA